MQLPRRTFLHLAAGAVGLPAIARLARADDYPSRPVHILVGFPAGGPTDIAARLIGQWVSERLGQPVVIDDRPGAATNIATEAVAHAVPDGYTLLAAVGTNSFNAALYPDLSFNFIRDFAMVAGIQVTPLVLEVNPAMPVKSVPELIAYAKANPGKVNMASFGTGTISQVAGALFKMNAGIDMVHVPYKGSAPMIPDLLAGRVDAALDNLPTSFQLIKDGKLRALAVTSPTRWAPLPDVPALAEFQPGFEARGWIGIAAPKRTPVTIIDKLNGAVNAALADPNIVARLADLGAVPYVAKPAELDALFAEQADKWGKVIRAANIKLE
jgi:tripartite-type tricarboxylate transporter receptor subunit TctC